MKLHVPLVCFGNHKCQWVVKGAGRLPLHTGKPLAPRLVGRWVKGICSGAYLYNHRIHTVAFVHIEQLYKRGFLYGYVGSGWAWPVYIVYRGYPYCPKFFFVYGFLCAAVGKGKYK